MIVVATTLQKAYEELTQFMLHYIYPQCLVKVSPTIHVAPLGGSGLTTTQRH